MSREYKFRCWIEPEENEEGIKFEGKMYDMNWIMGRLWNGIGQVFDEPILKLMQYTGLKDKNNIDIYEGDIMKGNFATGIGGVSTKYKEFNFSISYHQRQAQFGLDMPEHYGSYRFLPYLIQCEIIGNIYQNPELLNKK